MSVQTKNAVKRSVRETKLYWRMATGSVGSLPDFLIIGAQRSGTTSLFRWLEDHPQIFSPLNVRGQSVKEIQYFDHHYNRGDNWYRAHFPKKRDMPTDSITGEATPGYLYYPQASRRITKDLPDAKLIALLRNPVERALSNYFNAARKGRDNRPPSEALISDEPRPQSKQQDFFLSEYTRSPYKAWGIYVDQLKQYDQYLKNNQLLVLKSEDVFANPGKYLNDIFSFLGVKLQQRDDIISHNAVSRTDVPNAVYDHLYQFYQPHNERLYEYLGKDFAWD